MSPQELNIYTVMEKLLDRDINITEASQLMQKSVRQTKRIKKRFQEEGSSWLIHKLRWRPSNNTLDHQKYAKALSIINQEQYRDYGPTLAQEMLYEDHNIHVSLSSLRLQMIKHWLWKQQRRKQEKQSFTARQRKAALWEMIQHDGSYHKWFEWRDGTGYQCLLVSVDDATWEVDAKFTKNEGTKETFAFFQEIFLRKWKPLFIYLDKYATYKINYPGAADNKDLVTQFWRVAKALDIQLIFANSPQAKWRVERAHLTLQDRLVKALRKADISDIAEANIFLQEVFLPKYNKKFKVVPRSNSNMYRSLRDDEKENLSQIFSEHKTRVIMNDYTIRFENKYYQLFRKPDGGYKLFPWEKITVETHLDGEIKISKKGVYVDHIVSFEKPQRQFKFLTAPISIWDLEAIQDDMIHKEQEILELKKREKNKKENKKTDTYYQKYWKSHPFVANCFK